MSKRLGRKERKKLQQAKNKLYEMVPYIRVFNEMGMIETVKGVFCIGYAIEMLTREDAPRFNLDMVRYAYETLLSELPADMTVQFVIVNSLISHEDSLKNILVDPDKDEHINPQIVRYNDMISVLSQIGHNNVKKSVYFFFCVKCDTADEAYERFGAENEHIKELFNGICNLKADLMSIEERLRVMYQMYNPGEAEFGKRFGVSVGTLDLKSLAKKRITSKDLVVPRSYDDSPIDYFKVNDTYVRALAITSVPIMVSNNLISDITNISSSMVFSCIYEPFDSMKAFDVTAKQVTDNTVIRQEYKRDSLKDRKNKTVAKSEQLINHSEEAYFERMALDTMRDTVAQGEHGMLCTFTVLLYAEDLESLDRDTKLLYMSTSKFAVFVKPLDLQQIEGLKTCLPLCLSRIDCRRMLTIQRLSSMPPFIMQEVLNKDGVFNGLNTINDKLVLLNRRNNLIMAGIIAGTEHSGKTFQNKREIFGALMSSNDRVLIISNTDEYDNFVKKLGGVINESVSPDPFMMPQHYGIANADEYSKSLFLEALTESVCRNRENIIQSASTESARMQLDEDISVEVTRLFDELGDIGRLGYEKICGYIHADREEYPLLNQLVEFLDKYKEDHRNHPDRSARLQLYKVKTLEDTLLLLDMLFCYQLEDRRNRKSNWLFIDSMDDLVSSEQSATFLEDYIGRMNDLENIFTLVVQSSVKIFSENILSMRFADILGKFGYFKLLNQAAVERKAYTEILNIPNALVNYITAAEVSKGIILTPSSNVTFDDNFITGNPEDAEDERTSIDFYRLFKV